MNFITNEGEIAIFLEMHGPDLTMREIAASLGLTERTVARIIVALKEAEIIEVTKQDDGRSHRNSYRVHWHKVEDAFWPLGIGERKKRIWKEGSDERGF